MKRYRFKAGKRMPLWADVPSECLSRIDAVERLRKFVLDLAVRGKLVEQDEGDEPAFVILERIADEKQKLLKAKTIRKPKAVGPLDADEIPYAIPNGWEWVQIAQIGVISPRNEADDVP